MDEPLGQRSSEAIILELTDPVRAALSDAASRHENLERDLRFLKLLLALPVDMVTEPDYLHVQGLAEDIAQEQAELIAGFCRAWAGKLAERRKS